MKPVIFLIFIAFTLLVGCLSDRQTMISSEASQSYIKKGNQIRELTFETLSGHLSTAISMQGLTNALEYCNASALSLTDSLSVANQVKIKRTSLKLRNPKNTPDQLEMSMLQVFGKIDKMGQNIEPKLLLDKDQIRYFAPIFIQPNCLVCHGKVGGPLSEDTYSLISKYYPEDEAISYEEGDLRGIWSITFEHDPDQIDKD